MSCQDGSASCRKLSALNVSFDWLAAKNVGRDV